MACPRHGSPLPGPPEGLRQRGCRGATDALESLVGWCSAHRRKLIVVLDEYERLLDGRSVPRADGLDLLDFLRGLNQQHPKAFNFVFAGLDRLPANTHRLRGPPEPVVRRVFRHAPGRPRSRRARRMVRKLGRRASLEFDDPFDRPHRRGVGRAPLSGAHARRHRGPAQRDTAAATGAADPRTCDHRGPADLRRRGHHGDEEIADAVQTLGPTASLTHVVDVLDGAGTAALTPTFANDLQRYGILDGERARIGVFGRWLRRNVASFAAGGQWLTSRTRTSPTSPPSAGLSAAPASSTKRSPRCAPGVTGSAPSWAVVEWARAHCSAPSSVSFAATRGSWSIASIARRETRACSQGIAERLGLDDADPRPPRAPRGTPPPARRQVGSACSTRSRRCSTRRTALGLRREPPHGLRAGAASALGLRLRRRAAAGAADEQRVALPARRSSMCCVASSTPRSGN